MMDGNAPLPNGSVFGYSTGNLSATPLYFATTPDGSSLGGDDRTFRRFEYSTSEVAVIHLDKGQRVREIK